MTSIQPVSANANPLQTPEASSNKTHVWGIGKRLIASVATSFVGGSLCYVVQAIVKPIFSSQKAFTQTIGHRFVSYTDAAFSQSLGTCIEAERQRGGWLTAKLVTSCYRDTRAAELSDLYARVSPQAELAIELSTIAAVVCTIATAAGILAGASKTQLATVLVLNAAMLGLAVMRPMDYS